MINYSIFRKFKPKKRYLVLGIILLTVAKCAYSISTEDERYLEYLDNPPLITQKWPTIDGGFVTLEFPATYLYSRMLVFEPYIDKKNNTKSEQEKICEKYSCIELFQVLLPKLEPKNRHNTKYFNAKVNSKEEIYFNDNGLRIYFNTLYFTKNSKNYIPLKSDFAYGVARTFHLRGDRTESIVSKLTYTDILDKSKIRKIDNLDLMEIYDVDNDLMGGKIKVVLFDHLVKGDYTNVQVDPHRRNFLFGLNNKGIARVIECVSVQNISSVESMVKLYNHPEDFICTHTFIIDELDVRVEINYSKKYLNDSIEVENQVKKMFLSFLKEK